MLSALYTNGKEANYYALPHYIYSENGYKKCNGVGSEL